MTTIALSDWTQSPQIVVGEEERRRLTVVALTEIGHSAEHADYLLYELDRAHVVPDAQLPPDVVRIGSVVRYRPSEGGERTIELVLPANAERHENNLAVTTPEGAALLGLRPGQSISWLGADGQSQRIRVLRVTAPIDPRIDPDHDPGPSAA